MNFDIIVIGAGVIGSSTAYHLKKQSPKIRVLLLDKNDRVAGGNTAKSAALYRNLFSSETSQALALSSIKFYESIAPKIALKKLGYQWMFSEEDWKKSQEGLAKLDSKADDFEILEASDLQAKFHINTTKLGEMKEIHRLLFGHRCGALSATNLARYYANEFQQLGGNISLKTKITTIHLTEKNHRYPPWKDIRINSISDQRNKKYSANKYVFATGAWTNETLQPIGIASHIYPKKRQLFAVKIQEPNQIVKDSSVKVPILILPTGGVYLKPILEKGLIVIGCADDLGNPFQRNEEPPVAEEDYFREVIEPVLNHYFPKLTDYELFSKWAGYYAYYWPDYNPVIEQVANIQWVSGTSGSGIMKADAIGRIAAAKAFGKEQAILYDGTKFPVASLSLKKRVVDEEKLVI
ncbi:MAG: FAD-dependent oxidoreductase [Candidatus Heimdallarchaeota archaeon]|nr:FAD-dependent oxidoreductase [Candidatus Heimdallarchaeota archaeon]